MSVQEKYIVKRKLNEIVKHFKKEGYKMNKNILSSRIGISYPTMLKIFRYEDYPWMKRVENKVVNYITEFERLNGTLFIDLL